MKTVMTYALRFGTTPERAVQTDPRRFTVNDVPIASVEDWIRENQDTGEFTIRRINEIQDMIPGDVLTFGGAWGQFDLRRVA